MNLSKGEIQHCQVERVPNNFGGLFCAQRYKTHQRGNPEMPHEPGVNINVKYLEQFFSLFVHKNVIFVRKRNPALPSGTGANYFLDYLMFFCGRGTSAKYF